MKVIPSNPFLLIAVLSLTVLTGCTTATYGNKMIPVGDDTYTIKIYVGGPIWVGESGSFPRVKKEAEAFMAKNKEYKYYEVIESRKNMIPSYYLYRIKYFKTEKDSMIFQSDSDQ